MLRYVSDGSLIMNSILLLLVTTCAQRWEWQTMTMITLITILVYHQKVDFKRLQMCARPPVPMCCMNGFSFVQSYRFHSFMSRFWWCLLWKYFFTRHVVPMLEIEGKHWRVTQKKFIDVKWCGVKRKVNIYIDPSLECVWFSDFLIQPLSC